MDTVFPFGLPRETVLPLVLHVATWALHFWAAGYVVMGTLWLAILGVGQPEDPPPVSEALRDWLPAGFGGTITLAVAPLLFVQVLYRTEFYTAQTLMWLFWIPLGPILILAFYLLYLLKSHSVDRWSPYVVRGIAGLAFLCFLLTAFCWTANHLTSLDPATWPEVYRTGQLAIDPFEVFIRMGVWLSAMLPGFAVLVGWQLHLSLPTSQVTPAAGGLRVLAALGLVGVLGFGSVWLGTLPGEVQSLIWGIVTGPYLALGVVGVLLAGLGTVWGYTARSALWLNSLGVFCLMVSLAAIRETVRLGSMLEHERLDRAMATHADLAQVQGMPVFFAFLVLNATLIVLCIRAVAKQVQRPK